jgi:hypothetical protein
MFSARGPTDVPQKFALPIRKTLRSCFNQWATFRMMPMDER